MNRAHVGRKIAIAGVGLAMGIAAGLAGCASHDQAPVVTAEQANVTGTVGYRERITLPQTALVRVQLVDVSRADAQAVVLGEQLIEAKGRQPPFAFEIGYDPAKIDPRISYAVQARIEDGGQLRFISDQRYAVITRGAPTSVDLLLKAVGTGQ